MESHCSKEKRIFSFFSCGNACLFNVGRKIFITELFIQRNAPVISKGVDVRHNILLNIV